MKYMFLLIVGLSILGFAFCTNDPLPKSNSTQPKSNSLITTTISPIDTTGKTLSTRFNVPDGYHRTKVEENSFGQFLRNLPLKPHGTYVKYYNGETKPNNNIYCAVVDLPIGTRDLHQCADAIMRLRADFLRSQKRFEEIHFTFNNGFEARYDKWMKGYRIHFNGTDFYWTKDTEASNSDESYWKYLEYVFSFAGTYSLAQELPAVKEAELQIGDLFIWGGHPGHAVIVVDMAIHEETGEQLFMLAQSYMPAQEIQILTNPNDEELSPWYSLDFGDYLETPEWRFEKGYLKRF